MSGIKDKIVTNLDLFKAMVNGLEDGVFLSDGSCVCYANAALESMTGYSNEELIGLTLLELFSDHNQSINNDVSNCFSNLESSMPEDLGKAIINLPFYNKKNDAHFPATLTFRPILVAEETMFMGKITDCSELRIQESKLADLQAEFDQILNNIPDVFYRTDATGVFTMLSPASKETIGYEPEELLGTKISDLYASEKDRLLLLDGLKKADGKPVKIEATMIKKNGQAMWVSTNAYMRFDRDHNFIGVEGIARDSTERHNAEIVLHKTANTDPLTGLANRLCFNMELSRAVTQSANTKGTLALLYLDLDSFKIVNDTHGHHIGDELLKLVALRIKQACRKTDLVARFGGDEFVVLLEDGIKKKDTEIIAKKIVEQIASPFKIQELELIIGASVGISYFPEPSNDAEHFLRDADKAMYAAKKSGKGQIRSSRDIDR